MVIAISVRCFRRLPHNLQKILQQSGPHESSSDGVISFREVLRVKMARAAYDLLFEPLRFLTIFLAVRFYRAAAAREKLDNFLGGTIRWREK